MTNHADLTARVAAIVESGTIPCWRCHGNGWRYEALYRVRCPTCNATGRLVAPVADAPETMHKAVTVKEFDQILGQPALDRKLSHLRDCIAEDQADEAARADDAIKGR